MPGQYDDLFNQFGLPSESRSDYTTRKRRDAIRPAYERMQARGVRSQSDFGMALGDLFTMGLQAHQNKGLTEEEEDKFEMQDIARSAFESRAESGEFEGQAPANKSEAFQEELAAAAYDVGLEEMGVGLTDDLYEKRQLRRRKDLELQKLEGGVELQEQQVGLQRDFGRSDREQASRLRGAQIERAEDAAARSGQSPVWLPGEDQARQGYIHQDGTAMVGGKLLGANEFAITAPPGSSRKYEAGVGAKEAERARDTITAETMKLKQANQVMQVLAAAGGDQNAINSMGGAGQFAASLSKGVDNVQALARQAGDALVIEKAGGGSRKVSGKSAESAISPATRKELNATWANEGKTARQAAKLLSLTTGLAYMQALSVSPDGRIADSDFNNGAMMVGKNVTNPETMRQLLGGLIDQGRLTTEMAAGRDPTGESTQTLYNKHYKKELGAWDSYFDEGAGAGTAKDPTIVGVPQQPHASPSGHSVARETTGVSGVETKVDAQVVQSQQERIEQLRKRLGGK